MRLSRPQNLLLKLLMSGGMFVTIFSQHTQAESRQSLAVDIVSLKSGRTLRGAILNRQADGTISVAVSRRWLKKADSQGFDAIVEHNAEQQRVAWQQTKERIDAQLADPPAAGGMGFLLKQEQQRLQKLLANESPPEQLFVVIDVPA